MIKLKISNLSNPKSNEFNNKTKQIIGKSFEEAEFKDLIEAKDKDFREKISKKFQETRNDRIKLLGEDHAKEIEKRIFLQSIDLNWKSHIQYLEQLRQVIGLRSYGQRDPLIEYKKEAFILFENLLNKLKSDLITILLNLTIIEKKKEHGNMKKNNNIVNNPNPNCLLILNKGRKISRNDICEATGKKYKHCCGRL